MTLHTLHCLTALKHSQTGICRVENAHVSKLILSSQFIFPFFASIFLTLYFIYLIESEPINLGKKLNSQADDESPDEIKAAANSKVWIIVTISILFTLCAIATDIAAIVEYLYLPKEIEHYALPNVNSSSAFAYLHAVPFTMMCYDSLSFIFFIIVPLTVACYKCCKSMKMCKRCNMCYKKCSCCGKDDKCTMFQVSDFLYTLLSPFTCIATHSYHIIFAFINNPYHATSVLLFYIMTLFVVVVIFQKTYYFVLYYFEKLQNLNDVKKAATGEGAAKPTSQRCKGHVQRCVLVLSYAAVVIALAACIGLTVAVLIVLPLNNAIDLASNEIYAIYQASVTVFAALVTFQVFFRDTNSIFAVFIKAADKRGLNASDNEQEKWSKWNKKSEKEKKIHLGDILLSHIDFEPQLQADVPARSSTKSEPQLQADVPARSPTKSEPQLQTDVPARSPTKSEPNCKPPKSEGNPGIFCYCCLSF